MESEKTYSAFFLCCGIGGGARGFKKAIDKYKGIQGKFVITGAIDVNPYVCADFKILTGETATQMDLFSRNDYIDFHGHKPPEDWEEATPEDILAANDYIIPDVIFTSPPCKGLSGLLSEKTAQTRKYKALNNLTVRSIELCLEAFKDDLPAFFLLENVPRIASRGKKLLNKIKKLLKSSGYLIHPEDDKDGCHDCGELGGLGQTRKRYLLIARNPNKVPAFVYKPIKRRKKSIGEVLEMLPPPGDVNSGGLMHRMPNLQFLTWLRLALIRQGHDWRDLRDIDLTQYKLAYCTNDGMEIVYEWNENAEPIIAQDKKNRHTSHFRVTPYDEPGSTVTGATHVANGAPCFADPNLKHTPREGVYRVLKYDEPATTIVGSATVGKSNGATIVADPRDYLNREHGREYYKNSYRLTHWNETAGTVTSGHSPSNGGICVADPRIKANKIRYSNKFQVLDFKKPATTVTGIADIQAGAQSIADPRLGCECRSGLYGVQAWQEPACTVTGARNLHSGSVCVADPRNSNLYHQVPKSTDKGVYIIIAPDGTWHRPLTTLELAVLQDLPFLLENGQPLVLSGKNDAIWREHIGNVVPPGAAEAIAQVILRALLLSEFGAWEMSNQELWVMPEIGEGSELELIELTS